MRNSGFALVELLVALLVSGIAIGIAAGAYSGVSDSLAAMGRQANVAEEEVTGLIWLRDALLSTAVSTEPSGLFVGEARSLRFRTYSLRATGWTEPTGVLAAVEDGRLILRVGSDAHVFPDSLISVSFDYLAELGADSPWLLRFESATAAPLAVRLRRVMPDGTADTTLFFIGRGR
jgi:prepilin-type N-terminal cleavage/methylation domain-containing protein